MLIHPAWEYFPSQRTALPATLITDHGLMRGQPLSTLSKRIRGNPSDSQTGVSFFKSGDMNCSRFAQSLATRKALQTCRTETAGSMLIRRQLNLVHSRSSHPDGKLTFRHRAA